MSSQGTTPHKTTVPTEQIGTLPLLIHRVACCRTVSVCVRIVTRVTYNILQVKMGQDSRRAAWAELGVAPGVFAVVSASTVKKGVGAMFFFGLFFLDLLQSSGQSKVIREIVMNLIYNLELEYFLQQEVRKLSAYKVEIKKSNRQPHSSTYFLSNPASFSFPYLHVMCCLM